MKKDTKKWILASEKLSAINDYLTGKGNFYELGKLYNVSHVTVMNWLNAKDDIINECKACAILFPQEPLDDSLGEDDMKRSRCSLFEEKRRLLRDEKRLRYRVAYLDSLLKIHGINEKDVAKKNKYFAIQNANLSDNEKINISLFCSVADISRDLY